MTLVAILASLGIGSVLSAVVVGLYNKRKLSADATEIITKAASGVVTLMEQQMAAARAEHDRKVDSLQDEVSRIKAAWAREREDWRKVLQLHVAFDVLAIAKLGEAGIELGPAPPLLPPLQADLQA